MTRIDYRMPWLEAEQAARAPLRALLREAVQTFDLRGLDVVEAGCGAGDNLALLAGDNRVIGLEGLPEAVVAARAAGLDCRACDLEQAPWPLPDGSADVLLCLDILEHLRHPEQALAEARRVLRPGGWLIVNLPNHFDWRGRWRLLQGGGIDSPRYFPDTAVWSYPHLRFFRHADVRALLAATGFSGVADWSARQSSIPKARLLAGWGLQRPLLRLSARAPDLLASGFFVIARRAA